ISSEIAMPLGGCSATAILVAVEGENGKSRARIGKIVERFFGRLLVIDAVLHGVERNELHAWRPAQHFDRAHAATIYARGMGEQTETFSLHRRETVRLEHVDSEHDGKIFLWLFRAHS